MRNALTDVYFGLWPTGVVLVLGLLLPVLSCFYFMQAVLEDSGYLSRLSVLFDRVFRSFGLNGRGLVPLLLGFSCGTMAIMSTRMLSTPRERTIMTLLLAGGIPCAPMIAVMVPILAGMPAAAAFTILFLIGRLRTTIDCTA